MELFYTKTFGPIPADLAKKYLTYSKVGSTLMVKILTEGITLTQAVALFGQDMTLPLPRQGWVKATEAQKDEYKKLVAEIEAEIPKVRKYLKAKAAREKKARQLDVLKWRAADLRDTLRRTEIALTAYNKVASKPVGEPLRAAIDDVRKSIRNK